MMPAPATVPDAKSGKPSKPSSVSGGQTANLFLARASFYSEEAAPPDVARTNPLAKAEYARAALRFHLREA